MLWAAAGSRLLTEATFRIPVEFINVPADPESLTDTDAPVVQVWARGPSQAMRQASASDFVVRIDAASVRKPGAHTFFLDAEKTQSLRRFA